eukprot:151140-Pelagomonas_calceolata.AAC.1
MQAISRHWHRSLIFHASHLLRVLDPLTRVFLSLLIHPTYDALFSNVRTKQQKQQQQQQQQQ